MHARAGQGVEVGREYGHEGLALAGLHLGNAPLMEDYAADELDVEGLHAQHAPRGLAHHGERLRQQVVERLSAAEAPLEFVGLCAQLLVAHGGAAVAQLFHRVGDGVYPFKLPVVVASEYLGKKSLCYCLSVHTYTV